jgi:hypothetical protein
MDFTSTSSELCKTLEALEERRAFWASQPDRQVLPFQAPEEAMTGYIAILIWEEIGKVPPADWNEDPKNLVFYHFGEPLKPLLRVTRNLEGFEESFKIHKAHGSHFHVANDPMSRQLGFVCYCEAKSGVSHVVRIPITQLKANRPDFVKEFLFRDATS